MCSPPVSTKFGIFSDSTTGRLYINANYIRSGTIDADYIDLSCGYGGFCKGHGSGRCAHTTYGSMMYGSNGPGYDPYIIVTNSEPVCPESAQILSFLVASQ